ncbi:MAG: hypothetical protein LBH43_13965 [Treponema sp.]|jgi:hypothetical protein|nr:hypothetical protein [Treponema sp.]
MKKHLLPAGFIIPVLLFFVSCAGKENTSPVTIKPGSLEQILPAARTGNTGRNEFSVPLDGIAEIERSGGYYPGLAITESGLREKAGDYAGAVLAAYKELSFRYAYGQIKKDGIEEAMSKTTALFEQSGSSFDRVEKDAALAAVRGVMAFSEGLWEEAALFLEGLLYEDEEPDSFLNWMLLVCSLESGANSASMKKSALSLYGSIRARFSSFPEYWYRGARAHRRASSFYASAGIPAGENICAIYAEQCINLSIGGPFAGECRLLIAEGLGLNGDGGAIRSKTEIDETIRRSVSAEDPEILSELLPLINLPDNSYTNYAVGILKTLGTVPSFRRYFEKEAVSSQGRLAERLRYISRG